MSPAESVCFLIGILRVVIIATGQRYCERAETLAEERDVRSLQSLYVDRIAYQGLPAELQGVAGPRGQKESGEIFGPISRKSIEISVLTVPDGLSIRCSDSGPGIPAGQKRGCNRARTVSVTRLHATVSGRFAA